MLPCSRVGHVFRPRFPYSFPNRKGRDGDVVSRNLMRVADVWMDDYSKHFYNIRLVTDYQWIIFQEFISCTYCNH